MYLCVHGCVCVGSPVIKELQKNSRLSVHFLPDLPHFVKGTKKGFWLIKVACTCTCIYIHPCIVSFVHVSERQNDVLSHVLVLSLHYTGTYSKKIGGSNVTVLYLHYNCLVIFILW